MKLKNNIQLLFLFLSLLFAVNSFSQDYGITGARDINNILPVREQAKIREQWLEWRLTHILPGLMRAEGIDMWLVLCREYNEDPVYLTLVPEQTKAGKGNLIFIDEGEPGGVERYTMSSYRTLVTMYKVLPRERNKSQMENLAEFIKKRNPQRIGINVSGSWRHADGLTASLKENLEKALGPEYATRLVSAEKLCIRWLETRSPQELSVYRHICGVAHDIISEFYSNQVIIPDITTTDDVVWWIRQKIRDIGLSAWFNPTIRLQRYSKDTGLKAIGYGRMNEKYTEEDKIIRRGDLIHCDIGIMYLGLATDTQEMAYVYKTGEDDAPEGFKEGIKRANRLQDIFMNEFKAGRSGNDVFLAALKKAKEEGLKPSIYTHPLGNHGHAAGPTLGSSGRQTPIPITGDYPLYENTCYSIELNNKYNVPEWGKSEVTFYLEEDAAFTGNGCKFIDGRQIKLYLIK